MLVHAHQLCNSHAENLIHPPNKPNSVNLAHLVVALKNLLVLYAICSSQHTFSAMEIHGCFPVRK